MSAAETGALFELFDERGAGVLFTRELLARLRLLLDGHDGPRALAHDGGDPRAGLLCITIRARAGAAEARQRGLHGHRHGHHGHQKHFLL